MQIKEDSEIDIFVASRIGSFKHIKYHTERSKNNKKNIENLVDIKSLSKDDCITCMEWGNKEQTEVLIGKKKQQIQVYSTTQSSFLHTYSSDFAPGDIVGLGRWKDTMLMAVSSGIVKLWSDDSKQEVNTGGKLDRVVLCCDEDTFATGGEENDLKVYSIGDVKPTFSAKNLSHDWLQLRRPIWVTDACFLPEEGGRLVAVCSRHGYVRLYDTRAQRRPVCNVEFEKMAATCISAAFDERQVFVGFGRGQLHQVDLRVGKQSKGYKGCVGAVSQVSIDKRTRMLVSCSLDRRLRVHHGDTKELLYEQYLTSKLSRVLVQTESSTPLVKKIEEIKEEERDQEIMKSVDLDDMDVIFDKMETIGDKPKKKINTKNKGIEVAPKKIKPSTEGSTTDLNETDDAIVKLLRSTEKQKRRIEKRKKEKKARSVFNC